MGIAVARYLGPESYGIISYALAVYALCVIIITLGIDDIISKDMVENSSNRSIIEGTSIFLKALISLITYIIVAIYGYFNLEGEKYYVLLIINFALLFQPLSVFSLVFLSLAKGKYTSLARIFSYSISSILKIILIIIKADIIYFAAAVFLDYFILYITSAFLYKYKGYNNIKLSIDYIYLKEILKKAPVLFLNILAFTGYLKYNIIYISNNFTDFHAGIYNAALRLTEAFYLIPAVIATAFFPAVVSGKNAGDNEFIKRITMLFNVFTLPFLLISFLITLLSPYIINILYGQKYQLSSDILIYTIWSVPFIFFYNITSKYFIVKNKINHLFFRSLLSFMLLIIFNNLLIKYDILGTALSFSLSSFIAFYVIDLLFKESRNLFIIKTKGIFFPITYFLTLLKK